MADIAGPAVKISGDAAQLAAEVGKANQQLGTLGKAAAQANALLGNMGGFAGAGRQALMALSQVDLQKPEQAIKGVLNALASMPGPAGIVVSSVMAIAVAWEQVANRALYARLAAADAASQQAERALSDVNRANALARSVQQSVGANPFQSDRLNQIDAEVERLEAARREAAGAMSLAVSQFAAGQMSVEQVNAQVAALERSLGSIDRAAQNLAGARELQEEADAIKAFSDEMTRLAGQANQISEQMLSPLEKYNAELARMNELYQAGVLSAGDMARAVAGLQDQFIAANEAQNKIGLAQGVGAGSREALESIQRIRLQSDQAGGTREDRLQRAVEAQRQIQQRQLEELRDIRRGIEGGGGVQPIDLG